MSSTQVRRVTPRAKPRHGPSIHEVRGGSAKGNKADEAKSSNSYQSYRAWCERMGLPVAEFAIWRLTTARIPNT